MEHTRNISAAAPTDEQAVHRTPDDEPASVGPSLASGEPGCAGEAESRAWWDGAAHGLRCAIGENERNDDGPPRPGSDREQAAGILEPSSRRLRHDGWLPAKKARFLLVLVAGGVVADACRAVGMSVASAYALRNRRSGRAFAKMWDAILIHRARSRLADNNLSRAMNGCVEQIVKEGVVVAERRRFDNRLSMAMLTRLDRLAESKIGEEAELLRALSEDFEDYVEVVESGGDEDAFVQARQPLPTPAPADRKPPRFARDMLDAIAAGAGMCQWRHVTPPEIPIDDLDPDRMDDWGLDGWIRAIRSYYLDWIELHRDSGTPLPDGPDCSAAYDRVRRDIMAAIAEGSGNGEEEEEECRESSSAIEGKDESEWQPSTSSTSPAGTPSAGQPGRAGAEES